MGLASSVCSINPYIIAKIKVDTTEVIFIGLSGYLRKIDPDMIIYQLLRLEITQHSFYGCQCFSADKSRRETVATLVYRDNYAKAPDVLELI